MANKIGNLLIVLGLLAAVAIFFFSNRPTPALPEAELLRDAVVLGPPTAPDTVVAFLSYTCGHCQSHVRTLEPLLIKAAKAGKLRYAIRPVVYDEASRYAASVARCHMRQGGLTANAKVFAAIAQKPEAKAALAPLVSTAVKSCIAEADIRAAVQRDSQVLIEYQLPGTPVFFVNGKPHPGLQTLESLRGLGITL